MLMVQECFRYRYIDIFICIYISRSVKIFKNKSALRAVLRKKDGGSLRCQTIPFIIVYFVESLKEMAHQETC